MIAFGPVPSRRLGRSLGINNIPYKICTYSCVYCQIGRTLKMEIERKRFYSVDEIYADVAHHVQLVRERGEKIDYLTFVPDGEPTLDLNLKDEIKKLKGIGIPIAVITNGSLMAQREVRDALLEADFVSLKIDAVSERVWRSVDRPHRMLQLNAIMQGMREFAAGFNGTLVTETMLVDLSEAPVNVVDNLSDEELNLIADFLVELRPQIAYIAVPTRPPAEQWVKPAPEDRLAAAYHIFTSRGLKTEYLIGFEGDEFASTGDVEADLLAITAVHPMREDAVRKFLEENGATWGTVEKLLNKNKLRAVDYMGKKYFVRVLKRSKA